MWRHDFGSQDMKTVGSLWPSGKRVDEDQSLNPPLLRLLDEKLGLVLN